MKDALERYRKRVWVVKIAEGALAALFGLVLSYLLVFALDRVFDTPALLRGSILALGCVGLGLLFPLKIHNWVWSHRRLDQAARLLRHKFPRFGDHLLGIVELAQSDLRDGSRALVEAAMRQVDEEMERRDLGSAVPDPTHRRWAVAAGLPLALSAALLLIVPAAAGNALVRWSMPWRDVERYTFAQLEQGREFRVVPYAEPFDVEIRLKDDSPWKPEQASAQYRISETGDEQDPVHTDLDGKAYHFHMPPQTQDGMVSVHVGDTVRRIAVEPEMRPALKELTAEIRLPAYLERSEALRQDARGGAVSAVKGSSAILRATATRDLEVATLDGAPQILSGSRITMESIVVDASSEHHVAWRDTYGLEAREAQIIRFEAVEDQPPSLTIAKLKQGQVVLSNAVLAFEIQAGDDFGVKRLGIEWKGIEDPTRNTDPSNGEKIVAAGGSDQQSMTVPATFSAEREKIRPQSLRLRAFAEDYLPERERAYSPWLVLHVLTPGDHFQWLTEQMGLWAEAAQETYDKELQLHATNQELRDLPAEALDDPAQRKKIQNQAAAEKANAAKLASLVAIGKELVQEATKNEEFDPEKLENLAEIVQKLEEIAGKKMPSVADLLAQAAEAPGQPSDSEAPPSDALAKAEPGKPHDGKPEDGPPAPPGGKSDDKPKPEKYGPDSEKPPEGLDENPDDPNDPAETVAADRSKQPEGKPEYLPANPTPHVVDIESGANKPDKAHPAPQIKGGLLIPGTVLKGSGNDEEDAPTPATTAELVLQAVSEQKELLDAFAALAEDMNKLLLSFENSTFVKRLKAASRRQIDLAVALNEIDGFGVEASLDAVTQESLADRERAAGQQVAESDTMFVLQEDLAAYADRRPTENYTRVLDEMQKVDAPTQIREMAKLIHDNAIGQSTIEAEHWADTLDRWAEQLVDPLPKGPPGAPEFIELPNLTPEIVLEVLRIIDREIQLREETRELDQARGGIEEKEYDERGAELSETQKELAEKSRELAEKIDELPRPTELFREVLDAQSAKLRKAAVVMDEVETMLETPETGSKTIAAISEVIEILLETHRLPNAPMVVKAPPATASALQLIGHGNDGSKADIREQAPEQATGKSGREYPEEFRRGLDAYFDAMEGKNKE